MAATGAAQRFSISCFKATAKAFEPPFLAPNAGPSMALPAYGRPESLSLACPRETKEKGTPAGRPPASCLRVRDRSPRVRGQRILRCANARTSVCAPLWA